LSGAYGAYREGGDIWAGAMDGAAAGAVHGAIGGAVGFGATRVIGGALQKVAPGLTKRMSAAAHDHEQSPKAQGRADRRAMMAGLDACFAAGTPLRTPDGSQLIEQIRIGDKVLSRDEYDPTGALGYQTVEAVFVRQGFIWHMTVNGQLIRTTGEHPSNEFSHGWTPVSELHVGDQLVTETGEIVTVEGLVETGEWTTLYNVRVSEWHTYFVGCDKWGFSVWAHNDSCHQPQQIAEIAGVKRTVKDQSARYLKESNGRQKAIEYLARAKDYRRKPERSRMKHAAIWHQPR